MSISEPFIRRPIATSLLMVGVSLMGLLGYYLLPISALLPVDFPTIQVVAQYPGASPDVMASSVTTPLERQFGQISGPVIAGTGAKREVRIRIFPSWLVPSRRLSRNAIHDEQVREF